MRTVLEIVGAAAAAATGILFLASHDNQPPPKPQSTLAERINQICGQDEVTDWAIYEQDLVVTCAPKNSPYRSYAKVLPR